jgi:hypothetical protein
MGIGQRKTGCTVIEDSRSPGRNRMARCTLRRPNGESRRDVVRYVSAKRLSSLEVRLVAAITVCRTEGVIVVHMAGNAGRRRRRHVRADQSKSGRVVIKTGGRPTYCCMAYRTVR